MTQKAKALSVSRRPGIPQGQVSQKSSKEGLLVGVGRSQAAEREGKASGEVETVSALGEFR